MTAIVQHAPGEAQIPAPSANLPSGKIINDTALGACVVQGLTASNAVGDPINVINAGIVKVPAASATTFAKNAAVQLDSATGMAVAVGDFHIGRALEAKVSGQTFVRVVLNKAV